MRVGARSIEVRRATTPSERLLPKSMGWRYRPKAAFAKKWKQPLAAKSEKHRAAVRSANSIFWIGRQLRSADSTGQSTTLFLIGRGFKS
jgi:hypothetical protein